jgi:hypothetical protein
MKFIFIFLFSFSLLYSEDYIRIVGFDVKERDSRVDISIAFSDQYQGKITRQVGDSLTKLVIAHARLDRSDGRILNSNTVISKVDLLPFQDRVELVLSVMGKAKIIYKRVDGGYGIVIEIHDTTFSRNNKIVAEGESAFDSLSTEYFFTLIVLLVIVIILLFVKKNLERKQEEKLRNHAKSHLNNMDMLLDNPSSAQQQMNNHNHHNLLDTVQPPKMKFKTKKNPNSARRHNSVGGGIGENFNFGNPPLKENMGGLKPYSVGSEKSHVISQEDTDIGKIIVLQVEHVKYIILEGLNGDITLLDKEYVSEETSQKEVKNIEETTQNFQEQHPQHQQNHVNQFHPETPQNNYYHETQRVHNEEIKELFQDSAHLKL